MREPRIAVVGDIMLDTYYKGPWRKIGAEDIPVISIDKITNHLGAASTIANSIKSLGYDVVLFGYISDDSNGKIVRDLLEKRKIRHKLWNKFKQTIRKSKLNLLFRFDEETPTYVNCEDIFKEIKKFNPDIIVVSDFAKGTINQELFDKLKTLNAKIFVDPKDLDYSGAYFISPNLTEAKAMTGETDEVKIIKKLKKKYTNILLTKGKMGMSLYECNKKELQIPTIAKEVYDVTGAGDVSLATIVVLLLEGKSMSEACIIGNNVGRKAVEHIGQYVATREDLCI